MRRFAILLLLAASCPLHAQCVIGSGLWPSELRIEPQPALPGVPLELVAGQPRYITAYLNVISWSGSNLHVSGRIRDDGGFGQLPAPAPARIALGALPEGRYALTYAPRGDYVCTPMTITFQVGTAQAAEPVPLSPRMAAVLALMVLLIGSLRLRGLRSSRP